MAEVEAGAVRGGCCRDRETAWCPASDRSAI